MISDIEIALITDASIDLVNWHTWHFSIVHVVGFRDAKSDGRLAVPAMWSMVTWWRLAEFKKEANLELAENSPLHSFLYASWQGLLSVRILVVILDCIMKALKKLTAAAMAKLSTSH